MIKDTQKHSILSFDGGGSWSLLQALALKDLYGDIPGLDILINFDLVIANSGGSIILGGLLKNLRPSQICDFFYNRDTRLRIFSKLGFFESFKNTILRIGDVGARYSAVRKLEALEAIFGSPYSTVTMPQLVKNIQTEKGFASFPHIIIMGYDYDTKRARFFRSNEAAQSASKPVDPQKKSQSFVTLTDAIHISTNAPILYFDKPALIKGCPGRRFWDGAIAAYNNPLLAGITEAVAGGIRPEQIEVLSLGTGSIRLPVADKHNPCANPELALKMLKPGFLTDLRKISTAILDDPMDSATYMSYIWLTGGDVPKKETEIPITTGPLVRLNPLISPVINSSGMWDYPGQDLPTEQAGWFKHNFKKIVALSMDAAKDEDIQLLDRINEYWMNNTILNQPIRFNNNGGLNIEIGHSKYSEGADKWRAMKGLKKEERK